MKADLKIMKILFLGACGADHAVVIELVFARRNAVFWLANGRVPQLNKFNVFSLCELVFER